MVVMLEMDFMASSGSVNVGLVAYLCPRILSASERLREVSRTVRPAFVGLSILLV